MKTRIFVFCVVFVSIVATFPVAQTVSKNYQARYVSEDSDTQKEYMSYRRYSRRQAYILRKRNKEIQPAGQIEVH